MAIEVGTNTRTPIGIVNLAPLMAQTAGRPAVKVGLIDGPVAGGHPALSDASIHLLAANSRDHAARADDSARTHATFVAGMLFARRGSAAPAICPNCTLLVRPIFGSAIPTGGESPSATPEELGSAIIDCVEAGASIINLSLALGRPSPNREHVLEEALGHAMRRGVIVVAAAGNQGTIGSSTITRHPWAIPVVACDLRGRPLGVSNLAGSIGRRGMSAPGDRIISLGPDGEVRTFSGTSFAVPFVVGTIALLWSAFPASTAAEVRVAVTQSHRGRRTSVVPPLLDASAAYHMLAAGQAGGR